MRDLYLNLVDFGVMGGERAILNGDFIDLQSSYLLRHTHIELFLNPI